MAFDPSERDPSDRALFLVIFGVGLIGVVGLIPYLAVLLAPNASKSGLSLMNVLLISSAQNTFFLLIATLLGIRLARRSGYELPVFAALAAGGNWRTPLLMGARVAAPLGLLSGVVILAGDQLFRWQGVVVDLEPARRPGPWLGLSVALYGGINEEILTRLFLVSLFSWLALWFGRLLRSRNGASTPTRAVSGNVPALAAWVGISTAAVLFGLVHLPVTAEMTALTQGVIVRAIILNGIGAILFGYLFWKMGLAASMVAHFCADLILHVAWPLVSP